MRSPRLALGRWFANTLVPAFFPRVSHLRGGVDAWLLDRGRWRPAFTEAIEDEPTVAGALARRDWPRRVLMPLPAAESVVVRVTLVD